MASELKKVVRWDPTCYEAYYGLGLHDYYRSKASQSFDFLPFFEDRTAEGIRELQVCADKAVLTGVPARASLLWILEDEKEWDKASQVADWMIQRYPAFWDSYWVKAAICRKQGRLQEAAQVFEAAIAALSQRLPDLELPMVRFQMRLADLYADMGKRAEAISLYDRIAAWTPFTPSKDPQRAESLRQAAASKLKSFGGG